MLKHIKDKEMLKMVEDLNDIAWKMIAEHFHPNTGEWIGPQFRAYSDFIDDSVRTLIEAALDFKINLTDNKVLGLLDMSIDPIDARSHEGFAAVHDISRLPKKLRA